MQPGPNHKNFKSPDGAAKYIAAYDTMLSMWPVSYEAAYVRTRWGSTHVLSSGQEGAPSVLLLPGIGASATMWRRSVAALSQHYRVHAVDTIGSAGKSVADEAITSRADFVEWLNDVLDQLSIDKCCLVGHSHGAWVALSYALGSPERVDKVVLLAPAATLLPLRKQYYLRVMLAIFFPYRAIVRSFQNWMSGGRVERSEAAERSLDQTVLGLKHFRSMIRVFPSVLSDDELARVDAPTLLLIGEHEVIYDAEAAVERARARIPDLEAAIIADAGHGLPMERPEDVNERILDFLGEMRAG